MPKGVLQGLDSTHGKCYYWGPEECFSRQWCYLSASMRLLLPTLWSCDLKANERPNKIAWEEDNTHTDIRTSRHYERIGLRVDSFITIYIEFCQNQFRRWSLFWPYVQQYEDITPATRKWSIIGYLLSIQKGTRNCK